MNDFFDEQLEQSQIKSSIVLKYFEAWSKIMLAKKDKIGYIDLFSGPGRYKDGAESTPIIILKMAIKNERLRQSLVTYFNDRDSKNTDLLVREIHELKDINTLAFAPVVTNKEVGNEMIQLFEETKMIPSLVFVDPWGYKGLSLKLFNSVLKDWGCECIFFFNYNRINPAVNNQYVKELIDDLFGEEKSNELRERLKDLDSTQRELEIIETICTSINQLREHYVLPFRFVNAKGSRTSHHLIYVTKHPLGIKIMKDIMANASSDKTDGVASFEFNPATENQPFLANLLRPKDDLESLLLNDFENMKMTVKNLFDKHNSFSYSVKHKRMSPYTYTLKNYKEVLTKMELEGTIVIDPPHTQRRKIKGVTTLSDDKLVIFPAKKIEI